MQKRSAENKGLPYEIHLTVCDVGRNEFIEACQELKIKPVLLELQSRTNGILGDVMTSSRIVGTLSDAQKEMARISCHLRLNYGMAVTRYKLETVPWHPDASKERIQSQYMESHFQLRLPANQINSMTWRSLSHFCAGHQMHLSRNVFKEKTEEGIVIYMATLRDHSASYAEFELRVNSIQQKLFSILGITTEKAEIEFAIMDTNPSHDAQWMS